MTLRRYETPPIPASGSDISHPGVCDENVIHSPCCLHRQLHQSSQLLKIRHWERIQVTGSIYQWTDWLQKKKKIKTLTSNASNFSFNHWQTVCFVKEYEGAKLQDELLKRNWSLNASTAFVLSTPSTLTHLNNGLSLPWLHCRRCTWPRADAASRPGWWWTGIRGSWWQAHCQRRGWRWLCKAEVVQLWGGGGQSRQHTASC